MPAWHAPHSGKARARTAMNATGPAVAVVGGGIAGLAAARDLAAEGARVTVVEAGTALGGKIRAAVVGGVGVDVGPDAFVARRPEAVELCRSVGLGDDLVEPGTSGAALWARGRLRKLPDGIVLGVPTRLLPLARSGILGPAGLARAALDLLARPPADSGATHRCAPHEADRDGADDAVRDLVERHLGRQVAGRLADPLVGGINAGPTASMSAAAVFPALLHACRSGGSLMRGLRPPAVAAADRSAAVPPVGPMFLTVRGGLHRLVDRLADDLVRSGVTVLTSTPVEYVAAMRRQGHWTWQLHTPDGPIAADGLVLAVPAPVAARLLAHVHPRVPTDGRRNGSSPGAAPPPDLGDTDAAAVAQDPETAQDPEIAGAAEHHTDRLATLLGAIDYGSVSTVTLAFSPAGTAARWRHAPGTGYLVPVEQGLLTTGVTWLSTKWPHLGEDGPVLVRMSAGRFGDDRAMRLDDAVLVRRLLAELRATAGDVDDPVDAVVTRWVDAFPQYRVGHPSWVARVTAVASQAPPLALAGAAFDGVGIPACIGSGQRAAGEIAVRLGMGGR